MTATHVPYELRASPLNIVVASHNQVKVAAALSAFKSMFKQHEVISYSLNVASGVSDQPMSEQETLLGAKNRALAVKEAYPNADFYIGIEGGIEENRLSGKAELLAMAWVAIACKDENKPLAFGRSASFYLPKAVADLVRSGKELGEADDIVFKQENSKKKMGAIGLLSHGVLERQELYMQAVVCALVQHINPELY